MSIIATIQQTVTTNIDGQQIGEVYILLTDSVTGQPTNGDNIVVSYTQNINGLVTNQQTVIPGQSASIYSGQLGGDGFYTIFNITNISSAPDPAPPVGICDLAINYINVDKPESAPGAADGQITINATSSYSPILFSNDFGATYQSSPTFSGLTGGLAQPIVKDSNTLGCTAQGTVNIPVLSELLVSDPSATLTGGNISRWNAAFNPIVFTYQRKDFEVTAVSLDTVSGNAKLTVNCDVTRVGVAVAVYNQAVANANALNVVLTNYNAVYVYVNTNGYNGVFQVLAIVGTGQLVINTPFTATSTGYVNINLLRPYYQVRTQITYQDPLSGQTSTITSRNRPDSTGLVKADISNFLQSLLRAKDGSDFTSLNYCDNNLSAAYQIAYAEYWDGKLSGTQTLTFIPIANPYYVLYAAKQLGEPYGGNLAAYVPFRTVTNNSQLARWVTDFAEPAYSNGYPFDIGIIYSDDMVGLQLYYELTLLDINRNLLPGGPQASYLLNDDGSWLLNEDGSKLISTGQNSLTASVPGQLGLNRLLINSTFDPGVYFFSIALGYTDENGANIVTQTQTIRIDDAVDEQSVYLRWIGLSGSWNYYRFVYNQEISLDVQNAVIIKNYVSDWANQDGIEEVIGKNAGQKMKVMAEDLSVADIKGLQSIKYSPKVQMLVNKNPVKWQTVVLNTATFSEYETLNGQAPFSVTFNLPSINIQTQ